MRAQTPESSFVPAWWLPGPHAQTIGGRVLRSRLRVRLGRERLEMADGDFIDLDWHDAGLPADAPLVLVLHGLEGSAGSGYVRALFLHLRRHGIRAVGMNFRSCSGEPNRLPRFYHAGDTADLVSVLRHVRRRSPDAPLAAVGFSLGGNLLLKYLGESGEGAKRCLWAAAAVSVPFDLAAGARRLERGIGRVYARHFLRRLIGKATARREQLRGLCRVERLRGARTLWQFDDAVTAPLHGFAGAADYYARSSSAAFLGGIRVPTLLVHALDDPFLPADAVPVSAVRTNPALKAAFTERGGHVGFVGGSPGRPEFWAEARVADFLSARLAARTTPGRVRAAC